MKKALALALVASVFTVAPAFAKMERQVTRTIWELSDFPELEKNAKGVCASKLVMSEKLKAACTQEKFPSVTKAGLFRNTGIGAELNSLMRQEH